MGIDIIDNFKLGTDLPLDARYVGNPYDVSLYWYEGMQIYDPSTDRVWVVRDVSNEIIEPLLFDFDEINGGTNWNTPTDDHVNGGSW